MSKTARPMTMYGEGGEQLLPRTRTHQVYDGTHPLSDYITNGVFKEAAKVSHVLKVNGFRYDGSTEIDVDTIEVAHGGTGLTSLTSNKLMYAANNAFQFSDIFVNRDRVGIETSRPADGVSLATAKAIQCGTSITATNDVTAGGSVIGTKGVAAGGIIDPSGSPMLRSMAFEFAPNTKSANVNITLTHNLGNTRPMVVGYYDNNNGEYWPLSATSAALGFVVLYDSATANSINIKLGTTVVQRNVKIIVIG